MTTHSKNKCLFSNARTLPAPHGSPCRAHRKCTHSYMQPYLRITRHDNLGTDDVCGSLRRTSSSDHVSMKPHAGGIHPHRVHAWSHYFPVTRFSLVVRSRTRVDLSPAVYLREDVRECTLPLRASLLRQPGALTPALQGPMLADTSARAKP